MITFKRSLLCITLLISSAPFLHGCASPSAEETTLFIESDFAPTTNFGYAPFEFVSPDKVNPTGVQGFDAQLATQLARRLGFTEGSTFNQTAFSQILTNIDSPNPPTNIGISAISITPNRQTTFPNVAFIPYNDDDLAIILESKLVASNPGLQSGDTVLATLNTLSLTLVDLQTVFTLKGSRQASGKPGSGSGIIAQFRNTAGSPYLSLQSLPNTNQFDTMEQAVAQLLADLKAGNRRSIFTDTPTALALEEQGLIPGFTVITGVKIDPSLAAFDSKSLGIAIPASCCQLFANITQALKDMEDEGVLAAMREQWGTGSFTPPTDPVVPAGCNLQADIASNRIFNFIFTKYCPQTAAIL